MSNFLPDNYEQPQGGGAYTKLKAGENRIRIISNSIVGWLGWTTDKKPVRVAMDQKDLVSNRGDLQPDSKVKHFWTFLIWNYQTDQIEIFEISQYSIQESIMGLYKSSDWGDPKSYDMTITKTGESLETKYAVQGSPKSQFEASKVKALFHENPININALFENEDPFELDDVLKSTIVQKFDSEFYDLPFSSPS